MIKWPLSLFSRLYFSVALVIVCCVLLTKIVGDIYYQKEEFNHFLRNTSYVLESIVHHTEQEFDSYQQFIPIPSPLNFDFTAKLVNPDVTIPVCENCTYISTIGKIKFYELEEGELLAEYNLSNINRRVVIYEKLDDERNNDDVDLHHEEVDSLLFLISSLILMSITIYWPIKSLERQIRALNRAHQRFGAGDMKARADEAIQKPLNELALSFNQMADAIDKSSKERDVFSHAIPHEVRTPLSRIQLAAGLLRQRLADNDSIALIDNVDKYIDDINELITQIVEFSRLNSFKSEEYFDHYQTIKMIEFINSRLNLFEIPKEKTIATNICQDAELTTNPIYLRLIIDNLIKNALIYATHIVTISVSATKEQLIFSVEDDGCGIKAEDRETVFIPFARLDQSRSRKTGGLGLGLSITNAAVKKMNGNIEVGVASKGGARFTVTVNHSN